MAEEPHGRDTPAADLRPRSRAHRRELEVQRDHLASYTKRPQREGFGDIEHPIALLAGAALAAFGLKNWRSTWGLVAAGIGGGVFAQGLRQNALLDGHLKQRLLNTGASKTTHVRASITVDRPIDEVYERWRDLSHLPRAMRHLESVHHIGERRWHFEARVPGADMKVAWDAEIIDERPNELLVWRSVRGSEIHNEGMVEFQEHPGKMSTQIHAEIVYYPPAGKLGQTIARFLSGITEQIIKEDLRGFKQVIEAGEVPTIAGQTSGRNRPMAASNRRQTRPYRR